MKQYIEAEEFKAVMNHFRSEDYTVCNGVNWLGDDWFNDSDYLVIHYEAISDTVYHGMISIPEFNEKRKEYYKTKENTMQISYDDRPIMMDESEYFQGINEEFKKKREAESKSYKVHVTLDKILSNDASAFIVVFDQTTMQELLREDIKGAVSLDITTNTPDIIIATMSDSTIPFREIYNIETTKEIVLVSKPDLNYKDTSVQWSKLIKELISDSESKESLLKHLVEQTRHDLKSLGSHEMISGSMQYWTLTRVHNISASILDNYEPKMVEHIDRFMQEKLESIIDQNKQLSVHDVLVELEKYDEYDEHVAIRIDGVEHALTKNNLVLKKVARFSC